MVFHNNERKQRVEVFKEIPCGEESTLKIKVGVIRESDGKKTFLAREGAILSEDNLFDIYEYISEL